MLTHDPTTQEILVAVALAVGGVVAGVVFSRLVLPQLTHRMARTPWRGEAVVLRAAGAMPILWFFAGGVYAAVRTLPITPEVIDAVEKGLIVFFMVTLTWVVARAAAGFTGMWADRAQGEFPATSIFTNLAIILVVLLGTFMVLQFLGVSVTPLLTALGVGGLAVALALQDTLTNLFAGFHIIASHQVRLGDFVQLETGEEGYVADITWRNTTIREITNNMIVVPNAKLSGAILTNYYLPGREMALRVQVGVSYASDLEKVERVTQEVARESAVVVDGAVEDYEPGIYYHTFDDFSINFTVVMRVTEFLATYYLKHEFVKRLHRRYREEGIEIPFPIRTVHMRRPGDGPPVGEGEGEAEDRRN